MNSKLGQLAILSALLLFASQIPDSGGANILFFIAFGGASHRISMQPLAESLIAKGHNVTFLVGKGPAAADNSKINYYAPEKLSQYYAALEESYEESLYDMRVSGTASFYWLLKTWFVTSTCEQLYSDPTFVDWAKSTKFELIFVDALYNECGYGLGHIHGAKMIVFSTTTVPPWGIEGVGMPDESSAIPDLMSHFPQNMNFFQRMVTAVMPLYFRLVRKYYYFPSLTRITREGMGLQEFPSFEELERNMSLYFVNSYATQEFPRALPPNVVPIGGISWVEKRKPILQKMEDFINKGKDGFIYVSFGSFIDFSTFPTSVQETFISAFRAFPDIQFIWRLNQIPKDLPENIYADKWMPQQDLLLHPKIRAQITHGGIGGLNEAICSSVVLICFPIFADQNYNARLVESKGIGIKMEITVFTQVDMVNAIRRILEDDTYRQNMRRMTTLFNDRPMKPLETALWWTEYVLRHENMDSLRPLNVNQSWWVKRQLDVWLFLFTIVIASIAISAVLACKILKCMKRRVGGVDSSSPKKGKKQKKN